MSALKIGEQLTCGAGSRITVRCELGVGGQGTVYEVEDQDGRKLALKWYHAPTAEERSMRGYEEQRSALQASIGKGGPRLPDLPRPSSRFLWPLEYVEKPDVVGANGPYAAYGYLMELRPTTHLSIEELVLGRARFGATGPYRALCTAAVELADCFRLLHANGLCYKDINDGGAFFDPKTGGVLVCDNDNVRYDGTPGIIFKPEFAAPEVNRGTANCGTLTDNHSLAVLLYYMFCRGNPLEGVREVNTYVFEDAAKKRTFGTDPIFVFDPNNASNRPVAGVQDSMISNWAHLPGGLKSMFTRVFGEGLTHPGHRPTDQEWLRAFATARDSLFPCGHCHREIFYDRERVKQGTTTVTCRFCNQANALPPRLRLQDSLGGSILVLGATATLYADHLRSVGGYDAFDFTRVVARVVQNPKNPRIWGLRNESDHTWTSRSADGTRNDIPPGKSWVLREGQSVDLGGVKATVSSSGNGA